MSRINKQHKHSRRRTMPSSGEQQVVVAGSQNQNRTMRRQQNSSNPGFTFSPGQDSRGASMQAQQNDSNPTFEFEPAQTSEGASMQAQQIITWKKTLSNALNKLYTRNGTTPRAPNDIPRYLREPVDLYENLPEEIRDMFMAHNDSVDVNNPKAQQLLVDIFRKRAKAAQRAWHNLLTRAIEILNRVSIYYDPQNYQRNRPADYYDALPPEIREQIEENVFEGGTPGADIEEELRERYNEMFEEAVQTYRDEREPLLAEAEKNIREFITMIVQQRVQDERLQELPPNLVYRTPEVLFDAFPQLEHMIDKRVRHQIIQEEQFLQKFYETTYNYYAPKMSVQDSTRRQFTAQRPQTRAADRQLQVEEALNEEIRRITRPGGDETDIRIFLVTIPNEPLEDLQKNINRLQTNFENAVREAIDARVFAYVFLENIDYKRLAVFLKTNWFLRALGLTQDEATNFWRSHHSNTASETDYAEPPTAKDEHSSEDLPEETGRLSDRASLVQDGELNITDEHSSEDLPEETGRLSDQAPLSQDEEPNLTSAQQSGSVSASDDEIVVDSPPLVQQNPDLPVDLDVKSEPTIPLSVTLESDSASDEREEVDLSSLHQTTVPKRSKRDFTTATPRARDDSNLSKPTVWSDDIEEVFHPTAETSSTTPKNEQQEKQRSFIGRVGDGVVAVATAPVALVKWVIGYDNPRPSEERNPKK